VKTVVFEWSRMQPIGVEIAGSNSSQYFIFIFFQHFYAPFNPEVTVLLEYLDPQFTQGWFSRCNLIAVTAICFKQ